MGSDFNNRAAMNWGPIQTPNQQAAQQNAVNSVDLKQKPLVRAIASLIQAASADLYASNEDRKYRYIVDLILDRVRAALNTQLSDLSDTQLEAVSKQNEALLKSISTSTSGIVESAFSKLGVTLDKKQADGILDQFNDKLDAAVASLKDQIEKGQFSTSSSKKSSGEEDAATKADQLETIKSIDALKKQLAKQFSADKSSNTAPATSSGKKAFKAASALVISKQLTALAKNQKIINQSMTKRFEKTTKTISGGVERLHDTTSNNFYNLNDKLEDSMAKLGRQTKRISAGIVAGVVGAVAAITVGIKKTFGAVFSGLKAISGGLFRLFKKPAGVVGDLLKNLIATPGGMFAIGWIAGYVWKKLLKPLWDWAKPIRDAIGEWFGGKLSFKDMIGKIWSHLEGPVGRLWDSLKEHIKKIWDWCGELWFGKDGNGGFKKTLTTWWSGEDGKGGLKKILREWWQGENGNGGLKAILKEWWDKIPWSDWFSKILGFQLLEVPGLGKITVSHLLIGLGVYLLANGGFKAIGAGLASTAGASLFSKWFKTGKDAASTATNVVTKGGKLLNVAKGVGNAAVGAVGTMAAIDSGAKVLTLQMEKQAAAQKWKEIEAGTRERRASDLTPEEIAERQRSYAMTGGVAVVSKYAPGVGKVVGQLGAMATNKALDQLYEGIDAVNAAMDNTNDATKEQVSKLKNINLVGFQEKMDRMMKLGQNWDKVKSSMDQYEQKLRENDQEFKKASESWNIFTKNQRMAVAMNKRIGIEKGLTDLQSEYGRDKLDDHGLFDLDQLNRIIENQKRYDDLMQRKDRGESIADSKLNGLKAKLDKSAFSADIASAIKERYEDWEKQFGKSASIEERLSAQMSTLKQVQVDAMLAQSSEAMRQRYSQLLAENTKIGPDNMKFLPDPQEIFEQVRKEFENGGPVTEKVNQVGNGVEQVKEQTQETNQKLDKVIDLLGNNQQGQSLTIVNAPQVQAQERSFTTMDK